MKIRQAKALTYRKIDDNYYVTNSLSCEVIILNEYAFRILEVANNCYPDDVCSLFSDQLNASDDIQLSSLTKQEVMCFLDELKDLSLIEF